MTMVSTLLLRPDSTVRTGRIDGRTDHGQVQAPPPEEGTGRLPALPAAYAERRPPTRSAAPMSSASSPTGAGGWRAKMSRAGSWFVKDGQDFRGPQVFRRRLGLL